MDHPWRKNVEERMVLSVKCYRRVREDGTEKKQEETVGRTDLVQLGCKGRERFSGWGTLGNACRQLFEEAWERIR